MVKIINLTSNIVNIIDENGNTLMAFEKLEKTLSFFECRKLIDFIYGKIPLCEFSYVSPNELPEPKDGVYYIVNRVIAEALRRPDFLFPDDCVCDENGNIIGYKFFSVIKK